MALGQMNMSEKEFGEMELSTFFLKLFYFRKQQEEVMRYQAELSRLQTFHLINIQLSEKNKFAKPQDMYTFEWEEKKVQTNTMTQQELAEEVRKAKKILNV